MPDNQEISPEELEKATNEAYGELETSTPDTEQNIEPEPEPSEGGSLNQQAPDKQPGGQADISNSLKAILESTPYKNEDIEEGIKKLAEGYKNMQSEYTKVKQKLTPHEQFLADLETDRQFQEYIKQAEQLYRNPHLAQAYAKNGNPDLRPDPRSYDMTSVEGYEQYNRDMEDYLARQLDTRINSRLGQMEAQQEVEKQKFALKQMFPDADPDNVLEQVKKKGKSWTLADAYKALEFDNLKAKLTESIRKELTTQLENAGKTGSPTGTGAAKTQTSIADVIGYINKYGGAAARKRFGDKEYTRALNETAAAAF